MRNVIGRNAEIEEFEEIYRSKKAELVAVYGRRRVGKTFLIKSFFQSKECTYFQMTGIYKGTLRQQLARFSKELGVAFYNGATLKVSADWMEAFDELTKAINQTSEKNKKMVLFFDELPWMVTRKSGAVSALEYFWNRHWSDNNKIKLIVCGSAASWIIKKIIRNRGGLHNRITHKMRLLPFNLHDTFLFLKKIGYPCDQNQALKVYMIMGGVPFYLMQLKKNYSIDQNINKLFFNSNGLLFDEFSEVFSSLFENSEQYEELISLIARHKDGISRKMLKEKNKMTGEGGRLTKRLEDLESAGFISTYIPFGHKQLGVSYKISDSYCYFYLKWIKTIKHNLQQDRHSQCWKKMLHTPEYFNWMGYAFENVCYQHIPQIKSALELEDFSLSSSWRFIPKKNTPGKGAQIDLLFDRDDRAITLCEIKYTASPFVIDRQYAEQLKQKIDVFKKVTRTKKQLFLALISASGVKQSSYSRELLSGVVTSADLFEKEV